jgi:hypothetical protein
MTSRRNRRSLLGSLEVRTLLWIGVCAGIALAATAAEATGVVPDNGAGTIALPPGDYQALASRITDGLPVGTTIDVTAWLRPAGSSEAPGGSLGGNVESWNPATLDLELTGTGTLAGFTRSISIPGVFVETHSVPRIPGTTPQNVAQDLFQMQGQITGDPDFDLLRITAGTDFGMPSPGHTTLTSLGGGNWFVDSFFDINYRIDFVGALGGTLAGMSGSTTATDRYTFVPEPSATALGAIALANLAARRRCGRRGR